MTGARRGPEHIPREACEAAVASAVSLAGALRHLGIRGTGAARARLRRSLSAHGIPTDHFTGQGHTRGKVSPQRKSAEQILQPCEPGANRTKTVLLRRALDESGMPHRCAECGTGDRWQGRRLVLEIDHVNGDRLDNRRANLRYLCPSCHSQTRTFSVRSRRPAT
ncbi:HNH endonuclease signature motif containing protein [Actinacidiphila paucisporea]|uniref:HNH endonuclease n=1 Tax=Actinacidiphila paucisporea TaxID=310782 RepID=A0A1M6WFN5_9ACTN|nr:HNH endonuclease [Actinacidiphila paucisporea]SHK92592.1 HNH endonuclease [Actinacidiphila paucisporea]